jgi:hypothetical protein
MPRARAVAKFASGLAWDKIFGFALQIAPTIVSAIPAGVVAAHSAPLVTPDFEANMALTLK